MYSYQQNICYIGRSSLKNKCVRGLSLGTGSRDQPLGPRTFLLNNRPGYVASCHATCCMVYKKHLIRNSQGQMDFYLQQSCQVYGSILPSFRPSFHPPSIRPSVRFCCIIVTYLGNVLPVKYTSREVDFPVKYTSREVYFPGKLTSQESWLPRKLTSGKFDFLEKLT